MNNYKNDGFKKGNTSFGGKPKFAGGKRFGGPGRGHDRGHGRSERSGEDRELFKATCSSCSKSCEVPFRPSGDKPVFCRECFANKDQGNDRSSERGDSRGEYRRDARPQREERPARHEEVRAPRDNGNEDIKRQLLNLESKLDYILELLAIREIETESASVKQTVSEEVVVKKVRKPKTVKTKAPAKKKVAKKKAK
jgi:CxxC-x17-CxxC domain-containing protein